MADSLAGKVRKEFRHCEFLWLVSRLNFWCHAPIRISLDAHLPAGSPDHVRLKARIGEIFR
jgi:hypothetical protein